MEEEALKISELPIVHLSVWLMTGVERAPDLLLFVSASRQEIFMRSLFSSSSLDADSGTLMRMGDGGRGSST